MADGDCRAFLTSPTGSNQTFTSPSDCNNASNTIEVIGGGGAGDVVKSHSNNVGNAGGGGQNTATINIRCGAQQIWLRNSRNEPDR